MLVKGSLEEGGFILAYSRKTEPIVVGGDDGRSVRQSVTADPQSGSREMDAGPQPAFSFYFSLDSSRRDGAACVQRGSSHFS